MTRLAALTGATGFIGGHVMGALAARGWRLRILARRPTPAIAPGGAPVEVVRGDLADAEALAVLVRGCDAVVHMAGAIKAREPSVFKRTNIAGTSALVRAWRTEAPHARFLLLSSMAAREPRLSPYAATKRGAEDALRAGAGDGRWRALRPCAVYGPLDRETLTVFRLADAPVQLLPQGDEARLCLIHAADLARAVAAMLDQPGSGEVLEVTDARTDGYRWREIAAAAARALGRTPRPACAPAALVRLVGRIGDLAARAGVGGAPDAAKIRELLHSDWSSGVEDQPPRRVWRPEIELDDGFTETVAAYRAAGLLKTRTETGAGAAEPRAFQSGGGVGADRSRSIMESR